MKKLMVVLALVMTVVPAGAEESIAVAREAAMAAVEGDYEVFDRLANAQVKAAMNEAMVAAIAGQLEAQYGEYLAELEVAQSTVQGSEVFVFDLDFERAVVKLMVAIDADRLVSGLRLTGAKPKKAWEAPAYSNSETFVEEEVTFGTESFPLGATLSTPKGEAPFPAVVLVHGSGPHDRDESIGPNKPFKDLAWGLASRGVAVLRYEKRTKAHGAKMVGEEVTLDAEVIEDALLAASFLRARDDIDASRVFVAGHSLGGLALPLIADRDSELGGIISIAGPARPILDILVGQIEYISKNNGTYTEETEREMARIAELAKRGRAGETSDELVLGVPVSYWMELENADPAGRAAKQKTPILVIHGGRDYQVTMDCFEVWKRELSGRQGATVRLFESLNHLMISGDGSSTPEEYQEAGHVDESVIDAIVTWIDGEG